MTPARSAEHRRRLAEIRWIVLALACLLALGSSLGCQRSEKRRTTLFQEAEQHYRRGEYDAALDDYQVFLERYPRNRLAETARLRIRSINREIQSMMSRDDMPSPNYVGTASNGDGTSDGTSTPKRPTTTSRDAGAGDDT